MPFYTKHTTCHVALVGDIQQAFLADLMQAAADMQAEGRSASKGGSLTVIVDSPGGNSELRIRIVDVMRRQFPQLRFNTLVTGMCQSGAVAICASGFKGGRVAVRGTSFMTHMSRCGYAARNLPFDEFRRQADEELANHDRQRSHYVATLVECTRMNAAFWEDKLAPKDFFFGVDEALEYGLIDHIAETMADAVDYLRI